MKKRAKAIMSALHFPKIVVELFDVLKARRVDYLLAGDAAVLGYLPGFAVDRVDLIMGPEDVGRLPELRIERSEPDVFRCSFGRLPVDVFQIENPLYRGIGMDYAVTGEFPRWPIPCVTVEGMLLLKLYTLLSLYRNGDFFSVGLSENEITQLVLVHEPDTERLFYELAPYLIAAELGFLREIIADIQRRIERFRKRPYL